MDLGAGKIFGNQRSGGRARHQADDEFVCDDFLTRLGRVFLASLYIESGKQADEENDRAAPHMSA